VINLSLLSCTHQTERSINVAFYFWRSVFKLTPDEIDYLTHSQANKLYLKYFDIDWHEFKEEPELVAPIRFVDKIPVNLAIIPTVFITNRTLLNLQEQNIEILAGNIIKNTNAISQHQNLRFNEIQIDCDWTPKSREKYFKLLELLKSNFTARSIQVSVTLRLHQYKYPDITGIPPADRCMLMFYNMGEIDQLNTDNSILDINTAKNYLNKNISYPLDLDIALPIFGWGVLFRKDEIVDLLNNISVNDLKNKDLYQNINANNYSIIKSHYLSGSYVYNGDIIRIEEVDFKLLLESAEIISNTLTDEDITIAFFSLTENNIRKFSYEKIIEICDTFN